eukprot:GHVU01176362.1.p1 GENE.GHVU01176362.1~~GHVU01176362.1.p1  ORF type:complete len:358 (-),score=64.65 GHVU01176362.1:219-1292(-)
MWAMLIVASLVSLATVAAVVSVVVVSNKQKKKRELVEQSNGEGLGGAPEQAETRVPYAGPGIASTDLEQLFPLHSYGEVKRMALGVTHSPNAMCGAADVLSPSTCSSCGDDYAAAEVGECDNNKNNTASDQGRQISKVAVTPVAVGVNAREVMSQQRLGIPSYSPLPKGWVSSTPNAAPSHHASLEEPHKGFAAAPAKEVPPQCNVDEDGLGYSPDAPSNSALLSNTSPFAISPAGAAAAGRHPGSLTPIKPSSNKALSSCAVCLGDFEDDEEVRLLPCRHVYHRFCIDAWFEKHSACPMCNTHYGAAVQALHDSPQLQQQQQHAGGSVPSILVVHELPHNDHLGAGMLPLPSVMAA